MIHECTDCKHCADFSGSWRIICRNPNVYVIDMFSFYPLGKGAADDCPGFDDGIPTEFSQKDYDIAVAWAKEQSPDNVATWELMRQWCLQKGVT